MSADHFSFWVVMAAVSGATLFTSATLVCAPLHFIRKYRLQWLHFALMALLGAGTYYAREVGP